jgi:hypothetical protein
MVCSVNTFRPGFWDDGDTVADRATQYLLHRVFLTLLQVQVTVFFIPFEDSLAIQKSRKPGADSMRQFYLFLPIRCVGALKPCFAVFVFGIDTIEEEHVEMNIEIERTSELLDQCHRAGLRGVTGEPCFFLRWAEMEAA